MKRIYKWIIIILLVFILLFTLNYCYSFKVVNGNTFSMGEALRPNDGFIVYKYGFDSLEVGDIIRFHSFNPNVRYAHRVIFIGVHDGERFVMTKGDGNPEPDGLMIYRESYDGKVIIIFPNLYDRE